MKTTKYKIVLLPTEKDGVIWKFDASEKLMVAQGTMQSNLPFKKFDLHIISNDKIKIGDYFINGNIEHTNHKIDVATEESVKSIQEIAKLMNDDKFPKNVITKKIIASSDKEITPDCCINKSFIDEYVETHNEGKSITDVHLEVEQLSFNESDKTLLDENDRVKIQYKIKTENNYVIIQKPKLFTYNDVAYHIHSVLSDFSLHLIKTGGIHEGFDSDKWIEENL